MRRWLALAALSFAGAAEAAPFELTRDRLYVSASVNGRPAVALVDSGAEMSVLDDGFAARAGLALEGANRVKGTGGSVEARFAKGVNLSAAGVPLPGRMVVVIDLDDIARRLAGRPFDMILGRDFFDSGRIRIDFAAGEIGPVPPGEEPAGERFELVADKGIETIAASVEGQPPVRADFDLGNGSEVMVGRAYAERVGLAAPGRIVGRGRGGGIGGSVERDLVILSSLRVGGTDFRNVAASIDPTGNASDLNIGTRILKNFRILVDFPGRALWLEPQP